MASHTALARRLGSDDETIAALRDYANSERFDEAEKAALAVAEALTKDPTGLAEPLWDDLRRHYTDEQIIEIICSIGLFNYFNRLNNALEIEVTR
jgi:alkylhydroperoxidase family enzyme